MGQHSHKSTRAEKDQDESDNDDHRGSSSSSQTTTASTTTKPIIQKRKHPQRSQRQHNGNRDICLPPQGKTYLAIGQDLYSIQEYLVEQQNASLHWYMDRMARSAAGVKDVLGDDGNDEPSSNNKSSSTQHHGSRSSNNNKYETRMPVPNPVDAVPAVLMVYTDIQTLSGLDHPADYGSGIEYADGALRMAFSTTNNDGGGGGGNTYHNNNNKRSNRNYSDRLEVGLQVGLWLNGTQGCQDIIDGRLDRKVHQLVYYLGSQCPADKIFLRIGYGTYT